MGHRQESEDIETWVATMVMRGEGTRNLDSNTVQLGNTGSFDRQVGSVVRQVLGETTVGRGKDKNRLYDNAAGQDWTNASNQDGVG